VIDIRNTTVVVYFLFAVIVSIVENLVRIAVAQMYPRKFSANFPTRRPTGGASCTTESETESDAD